MFRKYICFHRAGIAGRVRCRTLAALALLASAATPAVRAGDVPAPEVSPEKADETVKRGVNFLWSIQKPRGNWETDDHRIGDRHNWEPMQGDSWGGFTALAVYALLAAGEKKTDPRMVKALEFLKSADILGIYALGLRCQVWLTLGNTAEMRGLLYQDVRKLEAGMCKSPENAGLWDYADGRGFDVPSHRIDHSVSQYGVLGLWAATQVDVPVTNDIWKVIDETWRKHQNPDGGWAYQSNGTNGSSSTPSMTAAGIATLFITQRMLQGGVYSSPTQANYGDRRIDDWLKWMASHIGQVENYYDWYGIERIGAASGQRYFGTIDWYRQGVAKLVNSQLPEGSWQGRDHNSGTLQDTSFCLLFLCHGRAPVMINKLDYSVAADGHVSEVPWNLRHRDIANLARFTGRNMEVLLNWQIVNLASPVEDWHDAPILYLAGNKAVSLTAQDDAKLKQFVEEGGMIVANADAPLVNSPAAKAAFPESIKELGKRLFNREFRPLPSSHLIFTSESYHASHWPAPMNVLGLSNGVRELMVLLPDGDPARAWQADNVKADSAKFELGTDLFLYAIDKSDLRNKGETYLVKPVAPIKRVVPVARLWVGANPDPEPGGWRRLNAVTINTDGTELDVRYVKLGDGSLLRPLVPRPMGSTTSPTTMPAMPSTSPAPRSVRFRVAHLTGTTAFKLSAAQKKELQQFASGGGTLIVDAAGGSGEFASSAETELAGVFGGALKDLGSVLPPSDPVYLLKGAEIKSFGWRSFARSHLGRLSAPRVLAIEEGDRATLFYSREDLSAGLVGEPIDGILGYAPATAIAIMRNLVLYACK
jgi:hypothetical protein